MTKKVIAAMISPNISISHNNVNKTVNVSMFESKLSSLKFLRLSMSISDELITSCKTVDIEFTKNV